MAPSVQQQAGPIIAQPLRQHLRRSFEVSPGAQQPMKNEECLSSLSFFFFTPPPSFLLKVLQSVFTITSTSYVPRSSNHLRASEALQLSESPTWNKEGTFQPDACYRNAVSVYLCKDIMSEEAAKQLSKNHLEKRLGEVVEQYFTQVAPMLTELKYHSLKESWGDPSTLKALQQAFYLMFPDESLREVYSCDDFREDYASWRMSKAETCCNQHKGQRDLICFDEAIAFLSEMQ